MSLSGVGLLGWYSHGIQYRHIHLITSLTGPDGEPRITHGNTLVSDLPLEEVAKTIDVSFNTC